MKWYGLPKQTILFQIFKSCPPQLLGPFLNILTQIMIMITYNDAHTYVVSFSEKSAYVLNENGWSSSYLNSNEEQWYTVRYIIFYFVIFEEKVARWAIYLFQYSTLYSSTASKQVLTRVLPFFFLPNKVFLTLLL